MRDIIERASQNDLMRQQRIEQMLGENKIQQARINELNAPTQDPAGSFAGALFGAFKQNALDERTAAMQPEIQAMNAQRQTSLARQIDATGGINPSDFSAEQLQTMRAKQIEEQGKNDLLAAQADYYRGGGAGAGGGGTGAIVKEIMQDNPGMSFSDALAYYKGGASAGGKIDVENRKNAQFNLLKIDAETNANIALLDNLTNHKGFSDAVGFKGLSSAYGLKEKPVAGTNAAGFNALFNQIKGKQFTSTVATLKGLGALSDAEGRKLEQAVAAMDTATSEADFVKARDAYKLTLKTALDIAEKQAGVTPNNPKKSLAEEAAEGIPNLDNMDMSELPQGAKQIGTSGGKPVFQTPDGRKFVQE